MELTQERLKEVLRYDLNAGTFTWLVNRGRASKSREAGCIQKDEKNFYRRIQIDGKNYLAQTLAFLYVLNERIKGIDHEDGDGLNNKWINLRRANQTVNCKNTRLRDNSPFGLIGVYWEKRYKCFVAFAQKEGRKKYLGSSKDFFEACCLRKSAEVEYGYHPNHGRR